jgi:hypothetical protein
MECDEIDLSYEDMTGFVFNSKLKLSIDNKRAIQLLKGKEISIDKKELSKGIVKPFWNWIIYIIIAITVYQFFVTTYWSIVPGVIFILIIRQLKKDKQEYLPDLALYDPILYENLRSHSLWYYDFHIPRKEYSEFLTEKGRNPLATTILSNWSYDVLAKFGFFLEEERVTKELRNISELPIPKEEIINALIVMKAMPVSVEFPTHGDEKIFEFLSSKICQFQENVSQDLSESGNKKSPNNINESVLLDLAEKVSKTKTPLEVFDTVRSYSDSVDQSKQNSLEENNSYKEELMEIKAKLKEAEEISKTYVFFQSDREKIISLTNNLYKYISF